MLIDSGHDCGGSINDNNFILILVLAYNLNNFKPDILSIKTYIINIPW